MKIFIGSDHAGYKFKLNLINSLKEKQITDIVDLGTNNDTSVDYPDFAKSVSKKLIENLSLNRNQNKLQVCGILICGSGQGMCMTANKFKEIRAAMAWDLPSAILSRQHNNATVLCLGARLIPEGLALLITEAWLQAEFQGGRHTQRVEKINS